MRILKRAFLLLLLTWLYAGPAVAQKINKAKLDSLFDALAGNNEAMGSVAVSRNGRILYSRAIGYSYIHEGDKIPATTKTKYRIASISKMFTAAMIFQLIDEGKLGLTTTLDTYFPELPNVKEITVSELLNHRSGLHNYITSTTWTLGRKSENELLAMIALGKPDFKPDSTTEYSNTNYWLLGFIIERISKMPYSDALQERIVSRLGLKDTYYGGKTDVKNNESYSYSFDGSTWSQYPETDMSFLGGAGGVISTPADETKFIEGLFSGKLISAKSLEEMTFINDRRGMGITPIPFLYHNGLGHSGHIDGVYSILAYFPEDSLAVAVCDNGYVYSLNKILIGILGIYFDSHFTIPDFKTMIDYNIANLDKYTGEYYCKDLSMKMAIAKNNNSLTGQATGQRAFPLHSVGKNKFRYEEADIEMEFNTDTHVMIFRQNGETYLFGREK